MNAEAGPGGKRKHLYAWIPLLFSVLLLGVLFRKIGSESFSSSLSGVRTGLLTAAVLISVGVNVFMGTDIWRCILNRMGCPITYWSTLVIRAGCAPFKFLMPLKSGEISKAIALKRIEGFPLAKGLGSVIFHRFLLVCSVGLLFMLGLIWNHPETLPGLLAAGLALGAAGYFLSRRPFFQKKLQLGALLSGFELGIGTRIALLGYCFLYMAAEVASSYILLLSAGVRAPVGLILLLVPVVILISHIPVAVGGIGTREAAIMVLFSGYAPAGSLLSAGLLISLVEYVLPVVIGVVFFKKFFDRFVEPREGEGVMERSWAS